MCAHTRLRTIGKRFSPYGTTNVISCQENKTEMCLLFSALSWRPQRLWRWGASPLSGQESAHPPVSFQNPGTSLHLSESPSTGLQIRRRRSRKPHSGHLLAFTDSAVQKREVQSQDRKGRRRNSGAPEVEGNIQASVLLWRGTRSQTNLSQIQCLSSVSCVSLGKSLQCSGHLFSPVRQK